MENYTECELMEMYLLGTNGHEKSYTRAVQHLLNAYHEGDIACKDKYYMLVSQERSIGTSYEKSIVILEKNSLDGISREYKILSEMYGERNVGYTLEKQEAGTHDGAWFDILYIKLPSGEELTYYFDISHFFGK